MRAKLQPQLSKASSVLLIGQSDAGTEIVRSCARSAKPVLSAAIKPLKPRSWKNTEVLAYCGIADPEKFYASLVQAGAEVKLKRGFADHHPFTADECRELMEEAKSKNLTLATTEKDWVRLTHAGEQQEALREANDKFERRFRGIEAALSEEGRKPEDATLEEMDALWNQIKAQEKTRRSDVP